MVDNSTELLFDYRYANTCCFIYESPWLLPFECELCFYYVRVRFLFSEVGSWDAFEVDNKLDSLKDRSYQRVTTTYCYDECFIRFYSDLCSVWRFLKIVLTIWNTLFKTLEWRLSIGLPLINFTFQPAFLLSEKPVKKFVRFI